MDVSTNQVTVLGRQGDVLIRKVPEGFKLPPEAIPVPREDGRIILAHGAATGHSHAIPGELHGAVLYAVGEMRYLRVLEGGCQLVHDEHDTLNIAAGEYVVIRQRETSGDTDRMVAD